MKYFSRFFLGAAVMLFVSTSVFAQAFEGVISMEISSSSSGEKPIPMSISTKGKKSLIQIEAPQGSMAMYMDRESEKTTMVMEAQKMGMEMDMKKIEEMAKSSDQKSSVKETDEKKMINGYNCELYTVTSEKGSTSNWWMTKDLPKSMIQALKSAFKNGSMGLSRGRKSGSNHEIEELFEKGLLPIRMESIKDGKFESTVSFLKYEQKKLDDSIFIVPADINIMQMPAGMGGH